MKNSKMLPNKATECEKDALGLEDSFMANGYQTVQHFAGGDILATLYGLTSDQCDFFRDALKSALNIPGPHPLEHLAEMAAKKTHKIMIRFNNDIHI